MTKRVLNILIIGNYGNYNLGDETILKGIIDELSTKSKIKLKFYIITKNPNFIYIHHPELSQSLKAIPLKIKDILKLLLKIDLIVIGGGGVWSSYTGFLAHLIPFFTIFVKLFFKKKIIFKNIGIYKTASLIDRFLVNVAILFANTTSVRDIESYETLWRINRRKVKVELDISLFYLRKNKIKLKNFVNYEKRLLTYEYNKIEEIDKMDRNCNLTIGFALKPFKNFKDTMLIINNVIKLIKKLKIKYDSLCVVFLPFSNTNSIWENDALLAKYIIRRIKNIIDPSHITLITAKHPITIYYIISKYIDVLVGMRYHSILFGYIANAKIIAIPYENKVDQFVKLAGVPYIPLNDLSDQRLLNKILIQVQQ